ncbi:MAG: hypothetical protein IH594_18640 [Bacteroidales bacterium]|nr:hypothetical protein [Bacteroidales bacterium]
MKTLIYLALVLILDSCNTTKTTIVMINEQAPVIVYKTKSDFFNNVPVTLNANKDKIVAYPAPGDLYYRGELSLPVELNNGYLLDRRGLGPNSVFTSYTYEEYSKLEPPPTIQELYESIIDKSPFEQLYNCGEVNDYKDIVAELNKQIKKRDMRCKSLLE